MGAKLPYICINRLRMETDGDGVTTLVAAKGCPLRCKYCINADVLSEKIPFHEITPEELFDRVKIDDLYFQASGGGIVFGGGEGLLHPDFLVAFAAMKPPEWKLIVETSLNVPEKTLARVMPYVDGYIADIKDMNPKTYKAYTGKDNRAVIRNLKTLVKGGLADRLKVRVPLIPGFNTPDDVKKSIEAVRAIGEFGQIEAFSYVIPGEKK